MKLAFEREHLAELRALGLLPQEVESLQRALPALAELLLPPVAMDARRDVLKNLHAALSTAETLVAKIEAAPAPDVGLGRSEEHTSELKSLMRISDAGFCLKKYRIIRL